MKRWQQPTLATIQSTLDRDAVTGPQARADLKLSSKIFDARPEHHQGELRPTLERLLRSLEKHARRGDRLPASKPLLARWAVTYDIYSPLLHCFVEVDERQHFSAIRLRRIEEKKPAYPAFFWERALPRLKKHPQRDLDPPHRDEQRAYLDECRELLPVAYGLRPTLRLDEFSLKDAGLTVAELINQAQRSSGGLESRELDRRLLDVLDFEKAKKFAVRLLEELKKNDVSDDYPEIVIVEALWMALVVSYSRPFKLSRDRNERSECDSNFAKVLKEQVPSSLLDVHELAIEVRDKALAHSDASIRDIRETELLSPFGAVMEAREVYLPPPEEAQIEELLEVVCLLLRWIGDRRADLRTL